MVKKTETLVVKLTGHVRRLCLSAVAVDGYDSEANMVAEAIRRYCQLRFISPITEEQLEAHKAANARKRAAKKEGV